MFCVMYDVRFAVVQQRPALKDPIMAKWSLIFIGYQADLKVVDQIYDKHKVRMLRRFTCILRDLYLMSVCTSKLTDLQWLSVWSG
jgi:hypothetical protein